LNALKGEDNDNALECLKRGEQLLEAVTAEGKDVDRNLIIVILYNLACCYQRASLLEDCASYLDGTIFNLESKVTNFSDNSALLSTLLASPTNSVMSGNSQPETARKFNISAKLFKLRYLCKCHLQLCAVLSQLNKHHDALLHGQKASFYCQELIRNTHLLCKSYISRLKEQTTRADDVEESSDFFGRRSSYYVEENERILKILTTNCEPILGELVSQVNHFNRYNHIEKAKESITDDFSVKADVSQQMSVNPQTLLQHAETNATQFSTFKKQKGSIHSKYLTKKQP